MEYAGMPPEVASGLVYTGPQSAPLAAAAAAWQALAADLGATATAMQSAVANLVGASWTGPTSVTMAGAGEQHVQWLVQAAAQAEETAALAGQAAAIVDAVYTGVVPPPLIAANRAALVALIGSNFMNCNAGAIAANVAQYQGMWAQDSTALYSFAGDSAGVVGGLMPFVPLAPTVNPAGAADQAASVSEAAAQAAGNGAQKATSVTNQLGNNTSSTAGGATDIMSMAPQFLSSVPQVLQGMAQPLMSGMSSPVQGLSGFQSLLSPFMSGLGGSGMGGAPGLAAAGSPALSAAVGGAGGGLGGIGGGTGALSAAMGGAPKLGGLSVPATWAASAQSATGANAAMSSSTAGVNANSAAAPGGASGGMGGGAAPMAAMNGREQSGNNGPSYGSPIRVLPRPR
jgi:PPE-repeat protein